MTDIVVVLSTGTSKAYFNRVSRGTISSVFSCVDARNTGGANP